MKTSSPSAGFSLVELLVATAVLVLLVVILSGIVSGSAAIANRAGKQLNSLGTADEALSQIGADLERAVLTGGGRLLVGDGASRTGRDDAFCFLVPMRPAEPGAPSRFHVIGYGIGKDGGRPRLQRDYLPVPWTNSAKTLPENALSSGSRVMSRATVSNGGREFIGGEVLRMALRLRQKDGRMAPISEISADARFRSDPSLSGHWKALDPADAEALSVTIAVLDPGTYQTFASKAPSFAAALPKPSGDQSPAEAWQQALDSGGLKTFPQPLRQNLRIFERTYSLQ